MQDFQFKDKYDAYDLVKIMQLLRAPGGCPWDAEQTHQSIKKNLIEETYEVIEAINKDDKALMCEELGDLLMQVVFHALMEQEGGVFDFDDVADGVCKKLIERHPHVFGEVSVSGVDDVLTNWDAIKRKSKGQKTTTESMLSVPRELPALMRATKLQKKAADVGFDWSDVSGALDKLDEETQELRSAVENGTNFEEELGDVLFAAVKVGRFCGVDPEAALSKTCEKFIARFRKVEETVNARGEDMSALPLDELMALWNNAKEQLR